MLTIDLLKKQETLAGLSDDQLSVIATMSKSDEETVLGKTIGELHGKYDEDILGTSGIPKNQGEKTYDYNKRVISKLKGDYSSTNEELVKVKEALGKKSEGDPKELKDLMDRAKALEESLLSEQEARKNEKSEFEGKLKLQLVDTEFEKVKGLLKFKGEYPENVKDILFEKAKEDIMKAHSIDFIEDSGKRTLVFRDEHGVILTNKNKALKPFTIEDKLGEVLKDVLDTGRKVEGGGSSNQKSKTGDSIDISSARSQVDADIMICEYLAKNGYVRGSKAFADKQAEIRTQSEVEKLPLR